MTTVFSMVSGVQDLVFPMGRDHGNYAAAGMVWANGGVLYRDALTFKPPATAWLHGIGQTIFGTTPMAVRQWDLVWTSATVAALTWLAWRLFGRRDVAFLSGITYSLVYWWQHYWTAGQGDGWLNLPAIVAVGLVLLAGDAWGAGRRRLATLGFVAAGMASAFAVLFKYTAAYVAGPMLVAFALAASRHGRGVWGGLIGVIAGGAGSLAAVGLGLWARGAGEIVVRTHTELIGNYVDRVKPGIGWRFEKFFTQVREAWGAMWYLRVSGLAALLPAIATTWWASRPQRIGVLVVVTWWVLALASIFAQGRFFGYHFLPLLVPNALLVGLAITWLTDRLPQVPYAVPLAALALLSVSSHHSRHGGYEAAWKVLSGNESLWRHYSEDQFKAPGFPIRDQRRVARYLRRFTEPDDRVLVWGFDPAIHVWAKRLPASALIYNFPLNLRNTDHDFWLRVLLDDLSRHDPAVVVVATGDPIGYLTGFRGDSARLLETYPELYTYILERYVYADKRGAYQIWKKGRPPGPPLPPE
ncbi:MAG: glycosyltransferase family 39 protein [Myxococcota bacterium]